MVTKKTKKVFKMILFISMVVVLLAGIGIGIYFIVANKNQSELLSPAERDFGAAVKNYNVSPKESSLNAQVLPADVNVEDVVYFSDSLIIVAEDDEYKVYDLAENEFLSLQNEVKSFDGLIGNLIFYTDSSDQKYMINSDETVKLNLAGLGFEQYGNLLFVRSLNNYAINFVENGLSVEDLYVALINISTGARVFSGFGQDDLINVEFCGKYFVVNSLTKCVVYDTEQNLQSVIEYLNSVRQDAVYNMVSNITGRTYIGLNYHSLSYLGGNLFLVERTYNVPREQYMITSSLSDDSVRYYSMSYSIVDVRNNKSLTLSENSNIVLSAQNVDFSDQYIAIVRSAIVDKSSVSEIEKTITYYKVDVDDDLKLTSIVSYDYVKFGKIVGFVGINLLTAGGTDSGLIDFSGKAVDSFNLGFGEKINSNEFTSEAVTITSVTGLKGVVNADGTLIHNVKYSKISPLINKHFVAKYSDEYYLLDTNKNCVKIQAFATQFEEYVFAGIGYYFTANNDGTFNVYNFDGTVKQSSAEVKIRTQSSDIVLNIGQEMLYIKPLRKLNEQNVQLAMAMNNVSSNVYNFAVQTVGADDIVIGADATSNIYVDGTYGVGQMVLSYSMTTANDDDKFRAYSALSASEKALIPAFDNVSDMSYTDSISAAQWFMRGVYFVSAPNKNIGVVAIIKLSDRQDADSNVCFMINIACKDSYVQQVSVSADLAGQPQNSYYFDQTGRHTGALSYLSDPKAGTVLDAYVGMLEETAYDANRTVNYAVAGFDGGVVFITDHADAVSVSFVLQNTYYVNNLTTEVFDWTALSDGQNIDLGHYILTVDTVNKKATIQTKAGYFFTSAVFEVASSDPMTGVWSYDEVERINDVRTTFTCNLGSKSEDMFRIDEVGIVERYSIVRFLQDDQETLITEKLYFYGYGDDVSVTRNPAPFGFNNFQRANNNAVQTKTGYDFTGFKVVILGTDYQVFDGDGNFVLANKSLLASNDEDIQTINMIATHTPKHYLITYKSDGDVIGQQTPVTYDAVVGSMFDIENSANDKYGYDFVGWKYGEVFITSTTVYQYPSSIEVTAVWTAQTYQVAFYSNLGTYDGLMIGGFDYTISSVKLAEDFGGFLTGQDFVDGTEKTITFDSTYGALPVINATNAGVRFTFDGWWTGSARDNKGTRITGATEVLSENPTTTLYAHYSRDLYSVALSEAQAHSQSIIYSGANSSAVKVDNVAWQSGINIYGVRNQNVVINIVPAAGCFVSQINVNLYDAAGQATAYVITGTYYEENGNYTVFPASLADGKVICTATSGNISLTLANIDNARVTGSQYASLQVSYQGKTHQNTITLTKSTTIADESVTASGFALATLGTGTHAGITYGSTTTYTINIPTATSYKGLNVQNSYLSKFKVGNETLTFEQSYARENVDGTMVNYNKLDPSRSAFSTVVADNKITSVYNFSDGKVKLFVVYDLSLQTYSYTFDIINANNNFVVEVGFDDSVYDVTLVLSNKSAEGGLSKVRVSTYSVVNPETVIPAAQEVGNASNSGNKNAGQTTIYDIKTDPGCYIANLKLTVAGVEYNITQSNVSIENGLAITNAFNTSADYFESVSQGKKLKGAGVYVTFDSTTREYQVCVSKVDGNVILDVKVQTYSFLTVAGTSASYNVKLVSENALYNDELFEDFVVSTPSLFKKSINGNDVYYMINGLEVSVSAIKVSTNTTDSAAYIISSSHNVVVDASNERADFVRNTSASADVTVQEIERSVTVTSYVGVGENVYRRDPESTFADVNCWNKDSLISNIKISYFNNLAVWSVTSYSQPSQAQAFKGKAVSFKVYDVVGYMFKSLTLKCGANAISPTNADYNIKKTDGDGDYYQYDFNLDNLNQTAFTVDIYQDAIKYNVEYIGNMATSGETANSVHYYNVASALSTNGYSRNGYNFLGYSLDQNAATADYLSGQTLNENLSTTNNATVTMYAIWSEKTYTISYQYNKGTGSSDPSTTEDVYSVEFEGVFPTLYVTSRNGYVFDGWYTQQSGGTLIVDGSEFGTATYNLFEIVGESEGSPILKLYAHWTAKQYRIVYNYNKGLGSTDPVTTDDPYYVTFDQNFPTLYTATRTGYIFSNWWTRVSGGVRVRNTFDNTLYTAIEKDETASPNPTITAYAHWISESYSITYSTEAGDGSSSVIVRTSGANVVAFDSTFASLREIARNGYTFDGWFTKQENGIKVVNNTTLNLDTYTTFIGEGNIDTVNKIVSLYAHWSVKTYAIEYNLNDSVSGNGTSPASITEIGLASVVFDSENAITSLSVAERIGYTFVGWFTQADGGVLVGDGGISTLHDTAGTSTYAQFTTKTDGDAVLNPTLTVYAHWSAKTYDIVYNKNDVDFGNGSSLATVSSAGLGSVMFDGSGAITGLKVTQRTGYVFTGWFTQADDGSLVSNGSTLNYQLYQLLSKDESAAPRPTITLYAQWQEKTYHIIYNNNDNGSGNGTSTASVTLAGIESVDFDAQNAFDGLSVVGRTGYTFVGWFTQASGGIQVGVVDGILTLHDTAGTSTYAQFTTKTDGDVVLNPTLTVYAHWNAKTYNFTIDLNDKHTNVGSTYANRVIDVGYAVSETPLLATIQVTFDQTFEFPALKRVGYDFIGLYKSKVGTQSFDNYSKLVGGRYTSGNYLTGTLNKALLDTCEITLDEVNNSCTVYSVWISKTFQAYVNLNNSNLDGFGKDDFDFVVNGHTYNNHYTTEIVDWRFDAKVADLPQVTANGYTFTGYNTAADGTGTAFVKNSTLLNKSLFDALSYRDSTGNISSLITVEDDKVISYTTNFSLYAVYTQTQYNLNLMGENIKGQNLTEMQVLNYDYTTVNSSSSKTINVPSHRYAVMDLWPQDGNYIERITLRYYQNGVWSSGTQYQFIWDSANHQVKLGGVVVSESGIALCGHITNVFSGVTIKALYNATGDQVSVDSPRLILVFDNVMTDLSIYIDSVQIQTYTVGFYRYASGDGTVADIRDLLFTDQFNYNSILDNSHFAYPYTAGFKFQDWYYGSLNAGYPVNPSSGETVNIGSDVVKQDLVLVSYYTVAPGRSQVVNFHIWDNSTGAYVSRADIDSCYQLTYYDGAIWTSTSGGDGLYFDLTGMNGTAVNPTGGRLLTLPTPASDIWPTGTYFAGYVISDVAPANGKYFSHLTGENCIQINRVNEFDIGVMVEQTLSVYAVYNQYDFSISGAVSGNNVNVTIDLDFYEFKSGKTSKVETNRVYFAVLNSSQLQAYQNQIALGNTKEAALYAAIGGTLTNTVWANTNPKTLTNAKDGYIFAFVLGQNSLGNKYIYLVSENYLNGGNSYPA